MSALRDGNAASPYEKRYIQARLDQEAYDRLFATVDDLFDYFTKQVPLDGPCSDWMNNASMPTLRGLLHDHQKKYHERHAAAPQAGAAAGPPGSDSGYYPSERDPTSPMSDVRGNSSPQASKFDVFLVSAASPNAPASPLTARRDADTDTNLIDLISARQLCGNDIMEGDSVSVGCRREFIEFEGPVGRNTEPIRCVVVQNLDVNVVLSRHCCRPKSHSEPSAASSSGTGRVRRSPSEQIEYDRLHAEKLLLFAGVMVEQELRSRKRPPDDDNSGERLARRPKHNDAW